MFFPGNYRLSSGNTPETIHPKHTKSWMCARRNDNDRLGWSRWSPAQIIVKAYSFTVYQLVPQLFIIPPSRRSYVYVFPQSFINICLSRSLLSRIKYESKPSSPCANHDSFSDATKHLMVVSVYLSVRLSTRPSVRPSDHMSHVIFEYQKTSFPGL